MDTNTSNATAPKLEKSMVDGSTVSLKMMPVVARPDSTNSIISGLEAVKHSICSSGNDASKVRKTCGSVNRGTPSSTARISCYALGSNSELALFESLSNCSSVAFAYGRSAKPDELRTGYRPVRSKRSTPQSSSIFIICWLMTDCALPSALAAAEKEPFSEVVTNACSCSIVNISF